MSKHAGAEWMQENLKYSPHPEMKMSDLGRNVADLLGELFGGIYHLDNSWLFDVKWDDPFLVEIRIGWKDWSTYDFSYLTQLVFLAHHLALRVTIRPANHRFVHLLFWQRQRKGEISHRHPTLDEAVENFKKYVNLPEF